MGITQHVCGTDNVRAIAHLGSGARQRRPAGCGADAHPRPLRRPGWRRDGRLRDGLPRVACPSARSPRPRWRPSTASRCGRREGARRRRWSRRPAAVSWTCCGRRVATSSRRCPIRAAVEEALGRVPLRVHVDIVTSSQMLVDGEEVLLLPAQTRYEQPGGCTETTTERRVAFSPAIRGPIVGEAKAEWQIYLELAAAVDPAAPRRSAALTRSDPRGDRTGRAVLRGHPAPGEDRRPAPVGRRAPVRWLGLPDPRWQGPFPGRGASGVGAAGRPVPG